ncbi:uncharacterized protein LOC132931636 isoform X2 [Rhopalosiphum padi]|uniref:uncharacterized protein LOC132931636 isoform X2 n=1 Tax=Rhopalosiphum padi TaxID=40932 RepID=UPI00298E286F|nr:uncharacterized protein LOC132931636 isoform X2 [Rhopalosiphum padi]
MTWSPLTSSRVLEFLPHDTWTEVILISLEPNENGVYIATTEDKNKKQIEDMNNISIQSCFFEKVKEFKALEIVGVKINDNWHRGKMVCYNELQFHDTKIELIDVGCFYQTKLDNLFILPYYFLYEQLALPIQFLNFIPKTSKLTIKPDLSNSKLFEGVVLVDVFCNNIKSRNNENGKNQFDTKNKAISCPLDSNLSTFEDIVISKKGITHNLARQEKQKKIALKNGDYCCIQFFQDLSNIYVCKVIKNIANNNYIICDVDNVLLGTTHSKDQTLKKYPMVGDIVKVFSSLKKSYIRAKILKKNNDTSYDIFYIDYGNIETIMSNEVYELSQELCKPGLAIQVGISDLIPVKNNSMEIHEKIKNVFEIFINTNKLFQIEFDETSENHLQNLKFKEIDNGFYINDFVMNCLKESEPSEIEYKKPLNINSKINYDHDHDIKLQRTLNNNDIVYLRSFQSDNVVYVIKDLKLYNEVILNTTQDKSTVLKRDLISGDIVKVISENCTYRAKIKFIFSTDNIMVSVINIDTGSHHYVSSNSIYELSKDLIKIPGLSIRLKVDGLYIKNARLKDLLTIYIKSIENIPLYVEHVRHLNKHQTVNLKRIDNSENIFTEFYKIAKCKSSFICNEISNNNIDDEVINEPKENLKIKEFENAKLKNGDYCIISFFKDFKNIYVCKAVKDCNDSFYTNHEMDSLLNPTNHSKDCEVNAKPVLGDVVKVLSPTYNHFYRAKILSAESENCFRVSYIDYGDIEIAELCNIFELSDNLKNIPGNAVQIGIDISLDKIPNEEIIQMFDQLATQETQLSIEYNKYDKKGLENCVLKVISSGLNIKNEVLKLLSNQSTSSLLKS